MTDTGKRKSVGKAAKAVKPKPAAKKPKPAKAKAAAKPKAAVARADEPEAVVVAGAAEPVVGEPEVVELEVVEVVEGVEPEAAVSEVAEIVEATDLPESVTVDELMVETLPPESSATDAGAHERAEDAAAAGEVAAEPPVSAELKAIVEALIYASPEPLTPKALFKVLDSEPSEEVERAIEALKADYREVRGLHLVEIAGGLQIVTRPDLNEWVRRLFHERKNTRLSVQSLETLAVIAYRQPVTAAEITEIRGVNTSGVLATLVERKLIKTAGRKAVVGRPFLYATTKEFLLRFGLNDVSDLPKVEDLADALGFELPGLLNEGYPTELMLPLGEPAATPEAQAETTADAVGDSTAPAMVPWVETVEPPAGDPADIRDAGSALEPDETIPAADDDGILAETSQTAEPADLDESSDLDVVDGGQVTDEPTDPGEWVDQGGPTGLDEPADLDVVDGGQVTDEPPEPGSGN